MAHVGRLFVPFRTLHPAGEWFGRGIGLATARRIVHHYGGHIRAESKVRKGASFYFTLPAEPPR